MSSEDDGAIEDDAADAVVSLIDDEHARAVLVCTYGQAQAAVELTEQLDVAPSTVYDRLKRLKACELLVEHQQIDIDGHHRKVYRARLDRVVVNLTADGVTVRVERESIDPADRLTDAFSSLRQ